MPKSTNPSVAQFRRVLKNMAVEVRKDARREVGSSGQDLAGAIRAAAPIGPTGDLRASVRSSASGKLRVTVRAGGAKTTTKNASGHPYDYSLGVEFGNEHRAANPFFWPTYRRFRGPVKERIHGAMRAALFRSWNIAE